MYGAYDAHFSDDLWCKMRFFRDMLRNDIEGERAALQRGMKPDPRIVLSQWVAKGAVVRDGERGLYVKY